MKYRKKPIVIEAFQWFPEMGAVGGLSLHHLHDGSSAYFIETLEGLMHVSPGDYIITGVAGEKYPCKPSIFEQTYEKENDE